MEKLCVDPIIYCACWFSDINKRDMVVGRNGKRVDDDSKYHCIDLDLPSFSEDHAGLSEEVFVSEKEPSFGLKEIVCTLISLPVR